LESHARRLAASDVEALAVVPEFSRALTRLALQTTQAMGRGHGTPDPSGDVWIEHMLSTQPTAPDDEDRADLSDLVIVLTSGPDAGLTAVLDELTASFGTALPGPIVSDPVPHALALVGHDLDPTETASRYDQIARHHGTTVIHGAVRDPGRIAECYRAMRPHLDQATHLTAQPGAIPLDELMYTLVLATAPHDLAEVLVRSLLGPLLASRRHDRLLRTLETMIATNGTLEHTARDLQVSPKTVRARLDIVAMILGLPLDTVQSLTSVRMALDLAEVHRDRWPSHGDPRWSDPKMTRDLG